MRKAYIDPKVLVKFMLKAGKVKWVKRSGWLREKVLEPETVAEHSYRVALLARIVAPILNLNPEKLMAMAIFHDLAEGILGDPVTQRGKKQVAEHDWDKEKEVMKKLFKEINLSTFYKYWEENILENGPLATKYSKALYEIGKIATVWQALEYEMKGTSKEGLDEFWENAKYHVKNQYLKEILRSLKQLRPCFKFL